MRKMVLAAFAATMLAGSAQAVTYVFAADPGAQPASFSLTLAAPITSSRIFQRSDLDQPSAIIRQVEFCVRNTRCSLGFTNPLFDEINVFNVDDPTATPIQIPNPNGGPPILIYPASVSVSYDFAPGAFTTSGDYHSISAGQGTLRVAGAAAAPGAVPEPASWAMMIAGFGMVGAAMRRRKVAVYS